MAATAGWDEVLANLATSGGTDPILSTGDSLLGAVELTMDAVAGITLGGSTATAIRVGHAGLTNDLQLVDATQVDINATVGGGGDGRLNAAKVRLPAGTAASPALEIGGCPGTGLQEEVGRLVLVSLGQQVAKFTSSFIELLRLTSVSQGLEFKNPIRTQLRSTFKSSIVILSSLSGASNTTIGLVPAGAVIEAITCFVDIAITGADSWDCGDGTDVDRYGAALSTALNTEQGSADYTADPRSFSTAGQEVTITANGPNFTGGEISVVAFFRVAS